MRNSSIQVWNRRLVAYVKVGENDRKSKGSSLSHHHRCLFHVTARFLQTGTPMWLHLTHIDGASEGSILMGDESFDYQIHRKAHAQTGTHQGFSTRERTLLENSFWAVVSPKLYSTDCLIVCILTCNTRPKTRVRLYARNGTSGKALCCIKYIFDQLLRRDTVIVLHATRSTIVRHIRSGCHPQHAHWPFAEYIVIFLVPSQNSQTCSGYYRTKNSGLSIPNIYCRL